MTERTTTMRSMYAGLVWPLVALAVLMVFNAVFTPGFFALEARDGRLFGVLVDILNHGSRVAIVALGMTVVIATGGVDLSVGAVAAVAGAVTATVVVDSPASWPFALACAFCSAVSHDANRWKLLGKLAGVMPALSNRSMAWV